MHCSTMKPRLCTLLPRGSFHNLQQNRAGAVRVRRTCATGDIDLSTVVQKSPDVSEAKEVLRRLAVPTSRGLLAKKATRGEIAEAQVAVEALAEPVDYEKLVGSWNLIYTTARDVLPILLLDDPGSLLGINLPTPFKVGRIGQRFYPTNEAGMEGKIENIIKYSIDGLVEDEGITNTVTASYEIRSSQRIFLTFEKAGFGDIKISPQVEALIAPAVLPRGGWNHGILLALREFAFEVPLRRLAPVFPSAREGGTYMITYLDDDLFIGRALGSGGSFIFNRDPSVDAID